MKWVNPDPLPSSTPAFNAFAPNAAQANSSPASQFSIFAPAFTPQGGAFGNGFTPLPATPSASVFQPALPYGGLQSNSNEISMDNGTSSPSTTFKRNADQTNETSTTANQK
jgi:hypothetical protein